MIGGMAHYFLPVLYDGLAVYDRPREVQNSGRDLTGFQFARSDGSCSLSTLRERLSARIYEFSWN